MGRGWGLVILAAAQAMSPMRPVTRWPTCEHCAGSEVFPAMGPRWLALARKSLQGRARAFRVELQAQLIAALEAKDDEAGVPVQLGIGSVCSRSSSAGNTTVRGPLRFTCLVVLALMCVLTGRPGRRNQQEA